MELVILKIFLFPIFWNVAFDDGMKSVLAKIDENLYSSCGKLKGWETCLVMEGSRCLVRLLSLVNRSLRSFAGSLHQPAQRPELSSEKIFMVIDRSRSDHF